MSDITSFHTEGYRWLSNFWPVQVILDGDTYPSVENAYQAAKVSITKREPFQHCTPGVAKQFGQVVTPRLGWDEDKVLVMRGLIAQKFAPGTDLAEKLVSTGNRKLVEGNSWGDTFWGVSSGQGQNRLGRILMEQRIVLQCNVNILD